MKNTKLIVSLTLTILFSTIVFIGLSKLWLNEKLFANPSVVNSPVRWPASGFQLIVTSQKQIVYTSEPIILTIAVKNVSAQPEEFFDDGEYNMFSFVATNQSGNPVQETLYGQSRLRTDHNNAVDMAGYRHLKPGQVIKYNIFINALFDMTLGGKYHITVKQNIAPFKVGADIISNTVTVRNLGENPELLRKRCKRFYLHNLVV